MLLFRNAGFDRRYSEGTFFSQCVTTKSRSDGISMLE